MYIYSRYMYIKTNSSFSGVNICKNQSLYIYLTYLETCATKSTSPEHGLGQGRAPAVLPHLHPVKWRRASLSFEHRWQFFFNFKVLYSLATINRKKLAFYVHVFQAECMKIYSGGNLSWTTGSDSGFGLASSVAPVSCQWRWTLLFVHSMYIYSRYMYIKTNSSFSGVNICKNQSL